VADSHRSLIHPSDRNAPPAEFRSRFPSAPQKEDCPEHHRRRDLASGLEGAISPVDRMRAPVRVFESSTRLSTRSSPSGRPGLSVIAPGRQFAWQIMLHRRRD